MVDKFELDNKDFEKKGDYYSTLVTPTQETPLNPGQNGRSFLYRSRNKDVATFNNNVATRKIVVAAKSGNNFIARY